MTATQFSGSKYSRPGEGSIYYTLECGHVVRAKASAGRPEFKRWRECRAAAPAYQLMVLPLLGIASRYFAIAFDRCPCMRR